MKPRDLVRRSWDALTGATRLFAKDHLSAYAAQATFYLMLAVFPFTMLVCMATRLLPVNEETLLTAMQLLLPESYHGIGTDFIDSYYNENISSAKIVLIVFLIWTASRLIQALMNGFNTVYRIPETRSQTVLRLIGCLYTVALSALLVILLIMYALGSKLMGLVLGKLPAWPLFGLIVDLMRDLAAPALLMLIFLLSYIILPSHRVHVREELPGALMTAVFWRAMAEVYSVFLARSFTRYAFVYGSLTGVVMILVWLYACVYCWFVGAELNCWLRRRRSAGLNVIPDPKTLLHVNRAGSGHGRPVQKDRRD